MKKVLALVLTSALAVSVAAVSSTATGTSQVIVDTSSVTNNTTAGGQSNGAIGGIIDDGNLAANGAKHAELAGTNVYMNKGDSFVSYVVMNTGNVTFTLGGKEVQTTSPLRFGGPGAGESTSWQVEYTWKNGAYTGIPKGVNGEDMLKFRVSFDKELAAYVITMNVIKNPTVEIFDNVEVTFKVITTLGATLSAADKKGDFKNYLNNSFSVTINPFASDYAGTDATAKQQGGFTLMNERYTSKDVYKDAKGIFRINASNEKPVVDESAFDKAYDSKLVIAYPDYTITFPKVKNQDIALNLEADVKRTATVSLTTNAPILTATFHDVYTKDDLQIEYYIGADAQNYKGTNMFAYMLNSEGKPVAGTEAKVTITESNTLVIEIKAGSRLAAYGENVSTGTYGVFGSKQDATAKPDETGKNPSTGASDVINVATAFAAISLAAAGFVAINKASK